MRDRILKESDVIREVESLLVSDEMRHLNDLEYGNNQALYHVIDRIEDLPSADRPQGEWKHLGGDEWLCSECGYVIWTEGSWEHPLERGKDYCEHCGARMKGADDE